MAFIKRHWQTLISGILGPIVGVAAAFIYFNNFDEPNLATGYTISALIAILFHTGFTTILINQRMDDVDKSISEKIDATEARFIEKQEAIMKESFRVKSLTSSEAMDSLDISLQGAETVKNTYVNLSKAHGKNSQFEDRILSHYRSALTTSPGRKWLDITTHADSYDGRYDRIILPSDCLGLHRVYIVDSQTEIMNFLLIEKNGNPYEVYFGWIMGNTDQMEIFRSNEPALLDLFENYFRNIRDSAIEYVDVSYSNDEVRLPSKSRQLVGCWLSVSVAKNIRVPKDFQRYSIMKISIPEGKWKVELIVYRLINGIYEKEAKIESNIAQVYEGSIFFEYLKKDIMGFGIGEGFSNYRITQISSDIMFGQYMRPGSKTLAKSFATKISDDDLNDGDWNEALIESKLERIISIPEFRFSKEIDS